MNVYDFDGTILHGDTEDYFREYVLTKLNIKKRYKIKLKFFDFLFKLKLVSNQCYRANTYPFIKDIKNLDEIMKDFWDIHEKDIYSHYHRTHQENDVVVSATPRPLLEEIMKRLNIKTLISTEMDIKTGKISKLCRAKQKVIRYDEVFHQKPIEDYYFDKDHDMFLMKYAKNGYRVLGEEKFKKEK